MSAILDDKLMLRVGALNGERKAWSETDPLAPRHSVKQFSRAMEDKLQQNDRKPHWGGAEMGYLLRRLSQEVGELRRALQRGTDPDQIIDEAADVANFAMMIADNVEECGQLCANGSPCKKLDGHRGEHGPGRKRKGGSK